MGSWVKHKVTFCFLIALDTPTSVVTTPNNLLICLLISCALLAHPLLSSFLLPNIALLIGSVCNRNKLVPKYANKLS